MARFGIVTTICCLLAASPVANGQRNGVEVVYQGEACECNKHYDICVDTPIEEQPNRLLNGLQTQVDRVLLQRKDCAQPSGCPDSNYQPLIDTQPPCQQPGGYRRQRRNATTVEDFALANSAGNPFFDRTAPLAPLPNLFENEIIGATAGPETIEPEVIVQPNVTRVGEQIQLQMQQFVDKLRTLKESIQLKKLALFEDSPPADVTLPVAAPAVVVQPAAVVAPVAVVTPAAVVAPGPVVQPVELQPTEEAVPAPQTLEAKAAEIKSATLALKTQWQATIAEKKALIESKIAEKKAQLEQTLTNLRRRKRRDITDELNQRDAIRSYHNDDAHWQRVAEAAASRASAIIRTRKHCPSCGAGGGENACSICGGGIGPTAGDSVNVAAPMSSSVSAWQHAGREPEAAASEQQASYVQYVHHDGADVGGVPPQGFAYQQEPRYVYDRLGHKYVERNGRLRLVSSGQQQPEPQLTESSAQQQTQLPNLAPEQTAASPQDSVYQQQMPIVVSAPAPQPSADGSEFYDAREYQRILENILNKNQAIIKDSNIEGGHLIAEPIQLTADTFSFLHDIGNPESHRNRNYDYQIGEPQPAGGQRRQQEQQQQQMPDAQGQQQPQPRYYVDQVATESAKRSYKLIPLQQTNRKGHMVMQIQPVESEESIEKTSSDLNVGAQKNRKPTSSLRTNSISGEIDDGQLSSKQRAAIDAKFNDDQEYRYVSLIDSSDGDRLAAGGDADFDWVRLVYDDSEAKSNVDNQYRRTEPSRSVPRGSNGERSSDAFYTGKRHMGWSKSPKTDTKFSESGADVANVPVMAEFET